MCFIFEYDANACFGLDLKVYLMVFEIKPGTDVHHNNTSFQDSILYSAHQLLATFKIYKSIYIIR